MAKLRDTMETRRFLRRLDEARRRYSGPRRRATAIVGPEPKAPRKDGDDDRRTADNGEPPAATTENG